METRNISPEQVTELDVRPTLRAGGEPFSQIMAAIQSVPAGGALRLRATFKPTPLFHVLGKQGWSNRIESGADDDWVILFYRQDAASGSLEPTRGELGAAHLQKENPELQKRLKAEGDVWYLDVRTLSPPEPMELTLLVLEKLPKGTSLIQVNERVPQFLLPILEERGFCYSVLQDGGAEVRLRIGRAS
jgi:uncharacterized protein (DUF2249 family)